MSVVRKMISLKPEDLEYIQDNSISLSKFVRNNIKKMKETDSASNSKPVSIPVGESIWFTMYNLKKFVLGRCLVEMSQDLNLQLQRELLRPQTQVKQKRRLKPNPVISTEQRISELRSLIEQCSNITRYGIQKHFGWGCGVMERVHRALMSMFSDEISWNPKRQTYYWIANIKQEKLVWEDKLKMSFTRTLRSYKNVV